jgi:PAS domain S-box-containing protein
MPSLAEILLHTVDGVFAVDSDQRINFWNPACSQLLGISSEQAIGRKCCDVIKGMDPFGEPFCNKRCSVSRLGQGEDAPQSFPLWITDAKGERLKLTVSIILVSSDQRGAWTSVHLLRRDAAMDPLEAIDWPVRHKQRGAGRTHRGHAGRAALAPLSVREQEVIELLAEGLSTKAISQLLDIRPVTVRNHVQHIQQKLGVHSKLEAVAYVYRHNLIPKRAGPGSRAAGSNHSRRRERWSRKSLFSSATGRPRR